MEKIKVIVDWDENFGAVSDQIPGCVATHQSFDEVKTAYISAVEFHVEGLKDDEIPMCLKDEHEFQFELTTRALLYELDGVFTRSTIARLTGINEKQLRHYMSGFRTARPDKREKIINALHGIGNKLISII